MKPLMLKQIFLLLFFSCCLYISSGESHAVSATKDIQKERLALYQKTEAISSVPWYYLAAMDQYERNQEIQSDDDALISITFSPTEWYGLGNSLHDQAISIVQSFNGIGQDGNGDGKANPKNPEDVLLAAAGVLAANGLSEDDMKISLWQHYQRDLSVKTITNTAKVLQHFNTNALVDRSFPLATEYNYSYRSTWGDRRGFGGNRIHEGTDIFADYGTPVRSTTYGVIELKGWNLYGGWRIGIRDIYNIYHYYAHLADYADGIKVGDIVKPGDALGTVGSTGYGPPGTSGKFPPHLHYGMYKDNGRNEWSFDPHPYIQKWERMEKSKQEK